jgi:hypothetical protein
MGEVHTNNIETSSAELVDGFDRICFGPDCTDDRGTPVVFGRLELG